MSKSTPTAVAPSKPASRQAEAESELTTQKPPHPVPESSTDKKSDPNERRTRRQSVALVILATIAVIYTVYFGRAMLMPIMFAIVLALLLRPIVRRGRRWRIPEGISAAVLLIGIVVTLILGVMTLIEPAKEWIDQAPTHLQAAGERLKGVREQIDNINEASEKVEQIAESSDANSKEAEGPFPFAPEEPTADNVSDSRYPPDSMESPVVAENPTDDPTDDPKSSPESEEKTAAERLKADPDKPVAVEVQQPRLTAGIGYLSSTGTYFAQFFISLVLAYFLLASGDVLINNVLRILPSMREKRNVVELVYGVERSISSYLLTVSAVNLGLGIVIAAAMGALGVPNPLLWGAMAALFNFVPFVGALLGVFVVLIVSLLSFDSLSYAVLPPLVFWGLTALEGNFVTPHLLGRKMSLNPIVVFISLAFWGWMWGIGGALLAVPILAITKVTCDQFERTQPLGTLLGGGLQA